MARSSRRAAGPTTAEGHDLPTAGAIIATVQQLADQLRRAGGTVVWVTPRNAPLSDARREFYGDEVAERYRRSGGGTAAAKLAANFAVDPIDAIVEKTTPSALAHDDTALQPLLRANRIETVIVVGVTADVCVESTVRDAATRGYRTIVIGDAVAAGSDAVVNASLRTIYRSFGDVRSATEVLELVATDAAPAKRTRSSTKQPSTGRIWDWADEILDRQEIPRR
ncbi:MAG: cysteine hydrolase family protein [Acidimicrobiales bacterium]